MSTVKANNHQVGQSATANQNFTLYQPTVPDGTVRLGVGNAGATTADALTVTNAGNATLLGNLTVSGAGTSTFAGTLNATTALQSGGVAASRIVQGTAQATTSGTAFGYTGIPSWVKRITFQVFGVYTSSGASGTTLIQIGSGSYTTTGYSSIYSNVNVSSAGSGTLTNGFSFYWGSGASGVIASGQVVLTLQNPSLNTWVAAGQVTNITNTSTTVITGGISLAGVLDRIQITTTSGTFSAGSVNIIYEG